MFPPGFSERIALHQAAKGPKTPVQSQLGASRPPRTPFQGQLGAIRPSKTPVQGRLGAIRPSKTPVQGQLGAIRLSRTPFQGQLGAIGRPKRWSNAIETLHSDKTIQNFCKCYKTAALENAVVDGYRREQSSW